MSFKFVVVTPKGIYLEQEIESLTIKLTSGYRTILSKHAPLIGALDYAPMHIVSGGKTTYYAVHGGAIHIKSDQVIIMVNAIEHEKDIDLKRAQEAKERAEKRLQEKDENIDFKRAQLALARALARIKTANRQ